MKYILWWRDNPPKPQPYKTIEGLPKEFKSVKEALSFLLNHMGRSFFSYKYLFYDIKTWPELETVYVFPNDLKREVFMGEEAIVNDDLTYTIVLADPNAVIEVGKTWYKNLSAGR